MLPCFIRQSYFKPPARAWLPFRTPRWQWQLLKAGAPLNRRGAARPGTVPHWKGGASMPLRKGNSASEVQNLRCSKDISWYFCKFSHVNIVHDGSETTSSATFVSAASTFSTCCSASFTKTSARGKPSLPCKSLRVPLFPSISKSFDDIATNNRLHTPYCSLSKLRK